MREIPPRDKRRAAAAAKLDEEDRHEFGRALEKMHELIKESKPEEQTTWAPPLPLFSLKPNFSWNTPLADYAEVHKAEAIELHAWPMFQCLSDDKKENLTETFFVRVAVLTDDPVQGSADRRVHQSTYTS